MTTPRRAPIIFVALAALAGLGAASSSLPPASARQDAGGIAPATDTADAADPARAPAGTAELYRLRIVNARDGAIQASADGGETWNLIGRVLTPATTAAEGFMAAKYIEPGHVAAVAVHGIRLRVGDNNRTLHSPLVLSIDPVEYATEAAQDPNRGYGGLITGTAGILTDIRAGSALFRELAPLVGGAVLLETPTGALRTLPVNFKPRGAGEILVLPVWGPEDPPVEVVFENRRGGAVTGTFASGATRRLATVSSPVKGGGRFDGTSYTGLGRVNTNHTGVITVSTAPLYAGKVPEGQGEERRGGFQIVPASHAERSDAAGTPVFMSLAPAEGVGSGKSPGGFTLEATAPLFRGTIPLGDAPAYGASAADPADATGNAVVDIAVDGGAWEAMPPLVGLRLDAFSAAGMNKYWKGRGLSRTCKAGVTAFRLRLPRRGAERSRRATFAAAAAYRDRRYQSARSGRSPLVKGVLTVNANPTNRQGVAFVRLRVEGVPRGFTNVAPFALSWDTRTVPDGDYLLEADALDEAGSVLATTRRRVFVLNHPEAMRTVAVGLTPVGDGR